MVRYRSIDINLIFIRKSETGADLAKALKAAGVKFDRQPDPVSRVPGPDRRKRPIILFDLLVGFRGALPSQHGA
jgi:hypothetical protein